MSAAVAEAPDAALVEAVKQLREAVAAKKCWSCGCLHNTLIAIDRALPIDRRPGELDAVLHDARERLAEVRYDCLGCTICYPAVAINALNRAEGEHSIELEACPTENVEERDGWPPLPGSYTVLRYQAPVAVCTLTDANLAALIAREAGPEVAIVGTLQTENLGIERILQNVLANPHIRFLVVCGEDSRQAIGHLPGQSLVALAHSGLDNRSRIIGARGKRPALRNIRREAVEHFRKTVEIVDLVGHSCVLTILDTVRTCASRNPGPAEPFQPERRVTKFVGHIPQRMVSDPVGYFVVYVDRSRRLLTLEHYQNNGVLDVVIEGHSAAELYIPAIDKGLISRLDHAAYLGRELARAERALLSGEPYIQDAAPEQSGLSVTGGCGCDTACEEGK